MAKPDAVFIFIGTYPSEAAARDDYAVVKDLHAAGAVGTYDAAVVTKTTPARCTYARTRWPPGTGRGAALPSVPSSASCSRPSIIGIRHVGAAVGGVGGHLWRGMSRADVKEFGDIIHQGQAALIIVGESTSEHAIEKAS